MTGKSGSLRKAMLATISSAGVLCGMTSAMAAPTVSIEGGDVVVADEGRKTVLTHAHADSDPALSPDGRTVVFTRGALSDDSSDCRPAVAGRQTLMSLDVRSGQAKVLVAARAGSKPETQLCNFSEKQFSSDGKRLYFSTPGWATSGALWVHAFSTGQTRYVLPSNGFAVLADCRDSQYRDKLAVSQHRYFVFGGSFDWYWLYDAQGLKQLGPIGETLDLASDACGKDYEKQTQP